MTSARLAARIAAARGWPRRGWAFAAGGCSALAMAPFDLWPVLFVTFPVCVWLLDGAAAGPRPMRRAALDGWWFGFGYFLAGLWWIGAAFLVEADMFGWLLPVPVLGLPAGLALFTALGFASAALIWNGGGLRPLAFALGLGAAEFLRGVVLTGFPWNAFGYALADRLWLGQAASVFGVEGLTFLALFIFSAPAALAWPGRQRLTAPAAAALALAALAGFGAARLGGAPAPAADGVRLRIVQPVVPRDARFRPSAGPEIVREFLDLSRQAPAGGAAAAAAVARATALLVWPESAFPFLLERTPDALAAIADALPDGTTLVTGAARIEDRADGPVFFNAVMAIEDGRIAGTYDKVHLVPFGEYLPFGAVMEGIGLQTLIRRQGGFTAGAATQRNLSAADLTFRPLICYEAVFPGESATAARPDALLNVTDDVWFGTTPGPYQHFAISRVRSIEQGLPLIRAANSGISAVVDPYGRSIAELPLGVRGVLDATLPRALAPTIYAGAGRWSTALLVVLLVLSYVCGRRARV